MPKREVSSPNSLSFKQGMQGDASPHDGVWGVPTKFPFS
jgi:hypothetical protein